MRSCNAARSFRSKDPSSSAPASWKRLQISGSDLLGCTRPLASNSEATGGACNGDCSVTSSSLLLSRWWWWRCPTVVGDAAAAAACVVTTVVLRVDRICWCCIGPGRVGASSKNNKVERASGRRLSSERGAAAPGGTTVKQQLRKGRRSNSGSTRSPSSIKKRHALLLQAPPDQLQLNAAKQEAAWLALEKGRENLSGGWRQGFVPPAVWLPDSALAAWLAGWTDGLDKRTDGRSRVTGWCGGRRAGSELARHTAPRGVPKMVWYSRLKILMTPPRWHPDVAKVSR